MKRAIKARDGTAARATAKPRRRAGRAKFPCARCGRPVSRSEAGHPRKIGCPRCAYLIYDYPRPCAGFVVVKGGTTLVLRRAHPPKRGFLDIPGGFMEAGETLEGAARRELFEETGLELGQAKWLGFYWDEYFLKGFGRFPTMNFYFIARWKSGEPRAGDDAASAEWVPFARLGRPGQRFAWKHMTALLRDARRWAARRR
ncbi:MAG: NUDIX domain-containing protein [Candidatus Eisenbacteria bacterium]